MKEILTHQQTGTQTDTQIDRYTDRLCFYINGYIKMSLYEKRVDSELIRSRRETPLSFGKLNSRFRAAVCAVNCALQYTRTLLEYSSSPVLYQCGWLVERR